MFESKKKEAMRTAVRLSLRGARITLYLCMVLIHTLLTQALRASNWTVKRLGREDSPQPTLTSVKQQEDLHYERKSEPVIKPEFDNTCSEGGEAEQDREGDSSPDKIPNCFEGTSDLSGVVPFILSDTTKAVRMVNNQRNGEAA